MVKHALPPLALCMLALFAEPSAAADDESCTALGGKTFAIESDTPVAVAPARVIPGSATLPAHCLVSGYVAPQVGFEVRLPLASWNRRFLQQGCRGMCGFIPSDTTNDALARGYAVATTDMGHKAVNSQSGVWAVNNPQGKIDFGHRATHVTALAAQALIEKFYGAAPRTRYFRGCGTGGRQALVEAQRHPTDFDGVIANGGIVFDFTRLIYLMAWSVRANVDAAGNQILNTADVELLHRAALAACDGKDGLSDGEIAHPQQCAFTPESLACGTTGSGLSGACLDPAKVEAARKLYAGPTQKNRAKVYPGQAPGSELRWPSAFLGPRPNYANFSGEIMRYFLPSTPHGPSFQVADFDLDASPSVFSDTEKLVSADTTDFDAFRVRNGKVLMIHGWNEAAMPGSYAVQYYDRLARDVGGVDMARAFFRLYMIPGDMHCTSGIPEGRHFDSLTLMEQWVEANRPTDIITGYEVHKEPKLPDQVRFPIDPAIVETARPFAPYPDTLIYRGKGDPTRVESYRRRK